MGNELHITINK